MKSIAFIISLLTTCGTLYGQVDTIIFEEIDFSIEDSITYQPKRDLTKHPYWRNHLKRFDIESIKADTVIIEAFRLVYYGEYFSIVEVTKENDKYFVTVDSSFNSGKTRLAFRSYDTIPDNSDLKYVSQYCKENKYKRIEIIESTGEFGPYIGNWAFEFKIDSTYNSIAGVEIDAKLTEVFKKIMSIGGLSEYKIYKKGYGFKYY